MTSVCARISAKKHKTVSPALSLSLSLVLALPLSLPPSCCCSGHISSSLRVSERMPSSSSTLEVIEEEGVRVHIIQTAELTVVR